MKKGQSAPVVSTSRAETQRIAFQFADNLKRGGVVALSGPLGAGKTVFVKGIAKAFGIRHVVSSPTFVLINLYKVKKKSSAIRTLVHVDCYRLQGARELVEIGIEDFLRDPTSLVVIEWAQNVAKLLPRDCMRIEIKHRDATSRLITLPLLP